jgi:hypothetical protein
MPLPFARTTAILTFALLHVACSHAVNIGADDRYANCADLGELALQSHSRADAEQRMRLRVLELGGDTLLIGERGRAGRLSASPAEIVERRNELLTGLDEDQPIVVLTAEQQEAALDAAVANAAQLRAAPMTSTSTDSSAELWFYGAALRCNSH